ncbi:hypothetical protein AVEN_144284-1 [Araneus ventricosus]|uniref:Uncharacterized protein n=1 Tax=Araneus ventricosus TaxID=182803 RepID=A0A4Y2JYX5_ARAVE|nr:hypothetical protein AVEN_144284-1 [Araneus ventricosus]
MYGCPFECLALSLANAIFKGNCYLLNWDGKSFGTIGMLEIKTLSPLTVLVITVALMTIRPKCVIRNRVPLRSLGTSRLRMNSTGTSTFNLVASEGASDSTKKLKNFQGYDVTFYCPLAYLQIDIL